MESQIGFAHFLGQTDAVGRAILAVLLLMSLVSWYLIVTKALAAALERRRSARFVETFWDAPSVAAVQRHLEQHHPDEPFSHLAWHAIVASQHHQRHGANRLNEAGTPSEFLTRAMRRVIDEDTARLESGLTLLASVGSTAPFVGLFGTVWGIMNSFSAIAVSKNTSLAVVAPGIAEALFATALGLIAAIPAVLAYNKISNDLGRYAARLESFSGEFGAILSRRFEEAA